MIISEISIDKTSQNLSEEEPCDVIINEEDNSQQMSPVELYDAMVKGNEKTGTKHQQERFNKNKRRDKRNKKNRYND